MGALPPSVSSDLRSALWAQFHRRNQVCPWQGSQPVVASLRSDPAWGCSREQNREVAPGHRADRLEESCDWPRSPARKFVQDGERDGWYPGPPEEWRRGEALLCPE